MHMHCTPSPLSVFSGSMRLRWPNQFQGQLVRDLRQQEKSTQNQLLFALCHEQTCVSGTKSVIFKRHDTGEQSMLSNSVSESP
jgi:hypothetical protein